MFLNVFQGGVAELCPCALGPAIRNLGRAASLQDRERKPGPGQDPGERRAGRRLGGAQLAQQIWPGGDKSPSPKPLLRIKDWRLPLLAEALC